MQSSPYFFEIHSVAAIDEREKKLNKFYSQSIRLWKHMKWNETNSSHSPNRYPILISAATAASECCISLELIFCFEKCDWIVHIIALDLCNNDADDEPHQIDILYYIRYVSDIFTSIETRPKTFAKLLNVNRQQIIRWRYCCCCRHLCNMLFKCVINWRDENRTKSAIKWMILGV